MHVAIIALYRELPGALRAGHLPHPEYFAGLEETYGPEIFGHGGVQGAAVRLAPALARALAPAPAFGLEELSSSLLGQVAPLLPTPLPDLYLGTLLFIAPAATLSVRGRPAMALGVERFRTAPPQGGDKVWYRPSEAAEMLPHEAAHAARMQELGLPPTPKALTLLDMVMLEGTALTFTDLLLRKETLATFMSAELLAWHRAADRQVRQKVAAEFEAAGMGPFLKYFSRHSPVSGYYAGYSWCREYLDRFGEHSVSELLALPSREILHRLEAG